MRQERWIITPSMLERISVDDYDNQWHPGLLHVTVEDKQYKSPCSYAAKIENNGISLKIKHAPITVPILMPTTLLQASVWDEEKMIATIFMMIQNQPGATSVTFSSGQVEEKI